MLILHWAKTLSNVSSKKKHDANIMFLIQQANIRSSGVEDC